MHDDELADVRGVDHVGPEDLPPGLLPVAPVKLARAVPVKLALDAQILRVEEIADLL